MLFGFQHVLYLSVAQISFIFVFLWILYADLWRGACAEMAKVLGCGLKVSEIKF